MSNFLFSSYIVSLKIVLSFCEITILYLPIFFVYRWGDPGVDGRIILEWIFRKWNVGVWTG
jgi:hypothetical protein